MISLTLTIVHSAVTATLKTFVNDQNPARNNAAPAMHVMLIVTGLWKIFA
jgi:hypothetical protein